MTYYDHATAMAFKLGRWEEERAARNFELEALASEQRLSQVSVKKKSIIMRGLYSLKRFYKPHCQKSSPDC